MAKALDIFADVGFHPGYRARPVERAIRQRLPFLAPGVLAGPFVPA